MDADGSANQSGLILEAVFEASPDAIAICDVQGKVRLCNRAYKELKALKADGPDAVAEGRVSSLPALKGLREFISENLRVRRDNGKIFGRTSEIVSSESGDRYEVMLTSVQALRTGSDGGGQSNLILLVLRSVSALSAERIDLLQAQFLLTNTETRVLRIFAGGSNLSRISLELGVTIHTARAHMKALMSKIGCRSQTDLIRLIQLTPTGNVRLLL